MEHTLRKRSTAKLFFTQFLLPQPIDTLLYFFTSLLVLVISSNRVLLEILADGSPIEITNTGGVLSEQLVRFDLVMQTPLLGKIILFLFWLAIGSVVYMVVWLFQNVAVEVYDDMAEAKLRTPEQMRQAEDWWSTGRAHAIFSVSSFVLMLLFVLMTLNLFFPLALRFFQVGLQDINQSTGGIIKLIASIILTMLLIHIGVLFWKLFFRLRYFLYREQ